jgi:hypothetical protein
MDPHAPRVDGFLSPIFGKERPQGYPPAGWLGNYRVSDKSILKMSLDEYVGCLTKLTGKIEASRALRRAKPAMGKELVKEIPRKQGTLCEISGDL